MKPGLYNTRLLAVVAVGLAFFAGAAGLAAQATGSVQGQVIEAQSQRPLASAQVYIPGTGIGTVTNSQGRFLLLNVPVGTQTVRTQLIGYAAQEQQVTVTAGGTATIDFELGLSAIALDEVVVTGQGRARERKQIAASVDAISEQTIQMAPVTSVDELLRGRITGATISATSAQPGTASLINFRGVTSVFGSQTPVIYVDGVRVDNDDATSAWTGGEYTSALSELLVADIERIEVTKGGAASTLFGSDAAAGVIQIFTKKGQVGQPRVTMRIEQGLDQPELKYILDFGEIFPDLTEQGADPKFLENNFFRNGHYQSYYLGVSGGASDFTYSVSGRLEQGDGVQPKNDHSVFSMRGGVRATITDRLSLDFSGNFTRSNFNRLYNGSAIADPLTTFEVGDAFFFSELPRDTAYIDEALDIFLRPDIGEFVNRFIFSTGARYQASDVFSARATVGVDHRGSQQRILEPIGFTPGEVTGELTRFDRSFTSVSMDVAGTLSYPLDGPITSNFTFGAQGFRDEESIIVGTGTTFALPGAPDIDEAAVIDAAEVNEELFNGGLYFEEQVGWNDRLFVNGGLRLDFNTTFGEDIEFKSYPKAGVSYLLSEEPALEAITTVLDEARVRVAYGQAGKFPEPFLRDRTFSATSFRGESAPRFENPGNPDLGPEVTSTVELGFDVSALGNRVGLGFTWYDAVTDDALFFVPEQPATGQGTQLRNIGQLRNTGVELDLNAQILNLRDVVWSVGATYQTVDNRVTDMGNAAPFFIGGTQQHVCGPPNDCDPDQDGLEELPVGSWFVTTPIDTNGDGLFDSFERRYTGKGVVPTSSGSFSTEIRLFDRLTLTSMADWARGFQAFDWGSVWATFNGIFRRELVDEDFDFPVRYGTDGTEIGEFSQSQARSAFIVDGDYLKWREIAAVYQVPEDLASRFGFASARVHAAVRNVAIYSRNPMIDPELNGLRSGSDLALGGESSITLPPSRQFRLGLRVTF